MSTTGGIPRRARLAEYVPWIARDYVLNQGPSTALVVVLIAYLSLLPVFKAGASVAVGEVPSEIAARLLQALLPPLAFIGTFFATNGIIANDRKFNYFRFLFAKPVNPLAYYSVVFLVYGMGLLMVAAILMGLWALVVRPMFPVEVFIVVALMYLAYGGIGFLLSAAWRFDWISLVTVILAANIGWDNFGDSTSPLRSLLFLLPPVHKATALYTLDLAQRAFPWTSAIWLAGYGAICYLLGLVVLRKRAMGTS
jgi:hypothetical protein